MRCWIAAMIWGLVGVAASLALAAPSVNVSLSVGDPVLSAGQRTSVSILAEVLNPASSTDGLFSFDLNVTFSASGILAIDGSTIVQPDAEILFSPGTVGPMGLSISYGTYFYHQDFGIGGPKELVRFTADALAPGSLNLTVSADTTIGDDFILHQSATPAVTYPAACSVSVAPLADRTWGVNAGGSFSTDSNWVTGVAPNAPGDVAIFGTAIDHNCTVAVDTPTTLGTLTFDDNNNYLLAGPSLLTLQAAAGDATVNVTNVNGNGNHRVTAPVKLSSPLAINHSSTGTLSFEGTLDNSLGMVMTKNGAGALVISGQQTHGVGAALDVTAGSVHLASDAGFGGQNLSVAASNAAALAFSASQHLEALALNGASTAVLGDTRVLVTKALAFEGGSSPTATFDLTAGNAVVDYPGGGTSPMAEVLAWVKSGLSGGPTGYWDGPGITSSNAHDATLTAVAVIDNNGLDSLKDDLEGEPVDHDAILIKYTYLGDNDLSGRVDWENDFLAFQNGVLFGIKNDNNWLYGDYNYDGKVDWENDFLAFQNGMLFQGGPLSGSGQASDLRGVPEPATLTLVALGSLLLLRRRYPLPAYQGANAPEGRLVRRDDPHATLAGGDSGRVRCGGR